MTPDRSKRDESGNQELRKNRVFRELHIVHWLARTGLGALFLYTGVVKALDPGAFAESIKAFELTGPRGTEVLTFNVPALEIVAGAILLLGIPRLWRGAATVLAGLLGVFCLAVALAWTRGLTVSCGCFGGTAVPTDPGWWLLRNAVLAGGLLALLAMSLWRSPAEGVSMERSR
jgi:uncharacterized membrane protein YphA (DoxX/SURF4 family)